MKRGIKHGHMPGDISKGAKILLLEKSVDSYGRRAPRKRSKNFKKRILMKERAVLKKRFQRELSNED